MTEDRTADVRARLDHAAKLLALSLTDEMIDSLRADYGSTNAGVLRHWKSEVLAALSPHGDAPQPDISWALAQLRAQAQRVLGGDSSPNGDAKALARFVIQEVNELDRALHSPTPEAWTEEINPAEIGRRLRANARAEAGTPPLQRTTDAD